jgi:hypothetical protein
MAKLYHQVAALILAVVIAAGSASVSHAQTADAGSDQVVGTVVRFTADSTSVDLTIGEDNPTVRDFLSMLPLTMTLEEYAGREKIGYFERRLATEGSPGSDPEDGDLIYFIPWGNIGFYYNTSGIGYSDQTVHIGTYNASLEELERLEGQPVRVEIVQ